MINRRKLLIAIGASAFASPLTPHAQSQPKVWRIGLLHSESVARGGDRVDAFRAGLRDLGYEEGKNYVIEIRWADGKNDRLPELAADLVRLKVDVLVTHGTLPLRAAMNATTTIPIVLSNGGDVIALGLVTNLARPGGNMTGAIFFNRELAAKRIELLKDVVPRLTDVAVLVNADSPTTPLALQAMEATAHSLKVTLHKFPVRGPHEFEAAFAAITKKRVGAIAIPDDPMFISNPAAIAEFAAKRRLPSVGPSSLAVAGGLMSYGVDFPALWRRAATFVDKIFKGTKPGDIPIEQATRFEMFVNMKTAKALGIKIPNSILVRADKVIE